MLFAAQRRARRIRQIREEREQSAAIALLDAPPPLPVSVSTLSTAELTEYEDVCQSIGIKSPASVIGRMLACLHDEKIPIYDLDEVRSFLNKKFGKGEWAWQGLRKIDVEHYVRWSSWNRQFQTETLAFPGTAWHNSDRVYSEAVPLPVLLTIQKVAKVAPEVMWYVSAPQVRGGDPFLMAFVPGCTPYIIERWDEPNFRRR